MAFWVGQLEGLVYILGPLLAAGLGSLFMAAVTAYAVGLLVAAGVEALALTLVFAVVVRPKPESHWLVRPLALALTGTLAACASIYLTAWLLVDDRGEVNNFVLPFVPAAFAFLAAVGCAIVIVVRALRSLRAETGDIGARAQATGRRAFWAALRLASAVVLTAGLLFLALTAFVALTPVGSSPSEDPEAARAVLFLGLLGLFFAAIPAVGLAYAGRPRPIVAPSPG